MVPNRQVFSCLALYVAGTLHALLGSVRDVAGLSLAAHVSSKTYPMLAAHVSRGGVVAKSTASNHPNVLPGRKDGGTCKNIRDMILNETTPATQQISLETSINDCYYFCSNWKPVFFGIQGGTNCMCFNKYVALPGTATCDIPCPEKSEHPESGELERGTCGGSDLHTYDVFIMTAHIPKFVPKDCVKPERRHIPHIENTAEVCEKGGEGDFRTCNITCAYGYYLAENSLVCDTVLGEWMGSASCKEVVCGPAPSVLNASSVCNSSTVHGADLNAVPGVCEVKCQPGFGLARNTLNCSMNPDNLTHGVYKGEAFCERGNCGSPSPRSFSTTSRMEILFPDAATYYCVAGVYVGGEVGVTSQVAKCQENGTLETLSKDCVPTPCGPAPEIEGASRSKMLNGSKPAAELCYPMVAAYECDEGHTLDATWGGARVIEVSCEVNGNFTMPIPHCKPVSCGPALQLEHAFLEAGFNETTSLTYHETAPYLCEKGYALAPRNVSMASFKALCGHGGLFEEIQACTAVSCGLPPLLGNASSTSAEVFYPLQAGYSCKIGYTMNGTVEGADSFQLDCQENGTFSRAPLCHPVSCGPLLSVNHSRLLSEVQVDPDVTFPSVLEYKCDSGYSTDKTAISGAAMFAVSCLPTGHFGVPPQCMNIDDCVGHSCGPYGHCVDKLNNYTCECESGYEVARDENTSELVCGNINDCGLRACGNEGTCIDLVNDYTCECERGFEQTIPDGDKVCTRVECEGAPLVDHATVPEMKAVFETLLEYTCDAGYSTNGLVKGDTSFSVQCLADKSWSTPKKCSAISCGDAPTVGNASKATPASLHFKEVASYTCSEGYTVDRSPHGNRSFTTQCTATGHFSATHQCLPVLCGAPPHRAMTKVQPFGQDLTFSQTALYTCARGYATEPSSPDKRLFDVTCTHAGKFELSSAAEGLEAAVDIPECVPVLCMLPQNVPKATLQASSVVTGGQVSFPSEVTYNCAQGHTTSGDAVGPSSFVASCAEDGQMLGIAECERVRCGEAPPNPNSVADDGSGELLFGDKTQYTCGSGFAVAGPAGAPRHDQPFETMFLSECLAMGMLTPPLQCLNIDDCAGRTCGEHGTCVDGLPGAGSELSYNCLCEDGFELRSRPENGELMCGNVDDCPVDACGSYGTCIDLVNDYTCECETGYILEDHNADHSKGAFLIKVCEPRVCQPKVVAVANSDFNEDRVLKYPEGIEVSCTEGYSVDGTALPEAFKFGVQCQARGDLTPVGLCMAIRCGVPPPMAFAHLSPPPSREYFFGENAEYGCTAGHSLDGTAAGATTLSLPCRADGTFPSVSDCKPVNCGPPPSLIKAHPMMVGDVYFGGGVIYKCETGYSFDPASPVGEMLTLERQCKANGEFSSLPDQYKAGECKKVMCGEPPAVDNAVHTASGQSYFQDVVGYTCAEGSSDDGTPHGLREWSIVCEETGVYSPMLTSACRTVTHRVTGRILDATDLTSVVGATVNFTQILHPPDVMGQYGGSPSSMVGAVMQEMGVEGITVSKVADSSGHFDAEGVPEGQVMMSAGMGRFISGNKLVNVEGSEISGLAADLHLSPVLPSDGWRIVLTWKHRPKDLDSHILFGSRRSCHVSYARKRVSCGNGISVTLDVDDTNGDGPETTTIMDVRRCVYLYEKYGRADCRLVFQIENYSRRPKIEDSGAVVKIFNGDREVAVYKGGQHGVLFGDSWSVCSIDARQESVQECKNKRCN